MNPSTSEVPLPPRPASHRWVIAIFGFATLGVSLSLINSVLDKTSVEFLRLPVLFASMIGIMVAFCSICFGGRRRWVYYLTSSLLIYLVVRNLQAVWLFGSFWLSSPPGETLLSMWDVLSYLITALLTILLAWRFILGHPSRCYFGFGGDERPS